VARIVVDQLKSGMRLGEDLLNRNGDLMAKAGAKAKLGEEE